MIARIGAILICLTAVQGNLVAQYSFDVKTPLQGKRGLRTAKQGIIHAIEGSAWATVKETGEDYSLWLVGMDRTHSGDSIRVRAEIQLRTKAFITRGRLLDSRMVSFQYHWKQAQQIARDSIDVDDYGDKSKEGLETAAEGIKTVAHLIPTLDPTTATLKLTAQAASGLLNEIYVILDKKPSPVELLESMVIGELTLRRTEDMVKNHR